MTEIKVSFYVLSCALFFLLLRGGWVAGENALILKIFYLWKM